ncbi:MAG: ferritin-like domain-containing protein [Alphaproteobacteria bacterium]|jgi:hypothetical protein|nr:ferritin-like domain-containing protein [Alphaproteobacteria bacterium]MDP6813135.1 ferritin-like domain-containing protein [Alphaproteobacteria bacterium]
MSEQITRDPAYNTVDRDDFRSMIEVDRYAERSTAFDGIIAATHDHFWDPLDKAYIDFDQPFDVASEMILPAEQIIELNSAVADKLDEGQRIGLANEVLRWNLSSILHGEQGALSLSASLCHILRDQGAQEYASNQAREEARHVTAYAIYIDRRWGKPLPVGECLGDLLEELVLTPVVYKKLVGMQILVEGLAMGAFANLHRHTNDPVLKRLTQLVMTDEAFHHKFGKIWADKTIPTLTREEHDKVEDWAAQCFEILLFNLANIRQRHYIYEQFGLDWEWVRDACREVFGENERRNSLKTGTNIFRVLVKTLLSAGIITDRSRHIYGAWVDMAELEGEQDFVVGDAIAAEGIEYLRGINAGRKVIGQKPTAM